LPVGTPVAAIHHLRPGAARALEQTLVVAAVNPVPRWRDSR
jgi:hypothetical protein